jgi:hypothetical protein
MIRSVGAFDSDTIYGWGGNDLIDGRDNGDVIDGWDGDDVVSGGSGDDSVYGGYGSDILAGGHGNDYLDGGKGNVCMFLTAAMGRIIFVIRMSTGMLRLTRTQFYLVSQLIPMMLAATWMDMTLF